MQEDKFYDILACLKDIEQSIVNRYLPVLQKEVQEFLK